MGVVGLLTIILKQPLSVLPENVSLQSLRDRNGILLLILEITFFTEKHENFFIMQ